MKGLPILLAGDHPSGLVASVPALGVSSSFAPSGAIVKLAFIVRCSVVVSSLFCASASAQQFDESTPAREHTGFFLHGGTGLGYLSSSYDGDLEMSLSGVSALFDFAVGGSVVPGLALHGTMLGGVILAPELEIEGSDVPTRDDASVNMMSLAGGLTYYTPINLYLSTSVGLGFVSMQSNEESASLEPGLAVNARLGYEWLVTRQLGLGVGLQLMYFSNAEKEIDGRWSSMGGGPMASLTYN